MTKTKAAPKGLSFEKALERLQEIVSELENPERGLESSLALFEEGVGLSRLCQSRIDEIQKRVEIVLKDTPDALVTESLEEDLDDDGEDAEDT